MLAVLGLKIDNLEKILQDNQNSFEAHVANDNSDGQITEWQNKRFTNLK